MHDNFVLALIISFSISAFLAVLFRELREMKIQQLNRAYRPYYDYLFVYVWILLSALAAVLMTLTVGGKL